MKQAKRDRQRPRTKKGATFSRPCKYMMRNARFLSKAAEACGNDVWRKLFGEQFTEHPRARASVMIKYVISQMRWHNFFVESEQVVSFLETSPILPRDMEAIGSVVNDKFSEMSTTGFFVHFASRRQSVFVMPLNASDGSIIASPDEDASLGVICWAQGISRSEFEVGCFPIAAGSASSVFKDREKGSIHRSIANLALYMDAFPECVHEGPPDLVAGSVVGRGSTQIGGHQSIRESMANGNVSPHMRRGHFRFLQSERYTSKRFETVFVKPSMVRGSAETVSEYA